MSSHPNEKPSSEVEQLQARLQNLRHLVASQATAAARKRKTHLIAGICIVALSAAALGNLTRLTFALDAQALAEIGRAHVEQSLPGGAESMKAFLEGQAPQLVSEVVAGVVATVPRLRPFIVQQASETTRAVTQTFEVQLTEEMKRAIHSSKADIDREFPSASDAEKVERLVASVAAQFEENMRSSFQALYPEYASEMDRIATYLDDLTRKAESELTPREKIQREILQILLRMAIHAHGQEGGSSL